ncbi:ribbon-helix-helix domain-containing protein [Thermosulfurimonas sp. F29]|uniref:ribbon-helix-helix domain-containing protein n=1 Tax=Thermosulfurimonas sp. F29 TaxID=2867247 RepID=UPI001C8350E1|nr:ribbon-helix-helix domain-containing protein [Thermosulfurimonas sp. F29]MBX6423780.1 ribbon-helix-helix domain-containing protein [Thermosulfurimonas sp. F29]
MTIYLPKEMRKRLEELSRETGESISRVIQKALEDFFLYEERKNKMRKFLDRWTGEKDEGLIEVWNAYQEKERKKERLFDEGRA